MASARNYENKLENKNLSKEIEIIFFKTNGNHENITCKFKAYVE